MKTRLTATRWHKNICKTQNIITNSSVVYSYFSWGWHLWDPYQRLPSESVIVCQTFLIERTYFSSHLTRDLAVVILKVPLICFFRICAGFPTSTTSYRQYVVSVVHSNMKIYKIKEVTTISATESVLCAYGWDLQVINKGAGKKTGGWQTDYLRKWMTFWLHRIPYMTVVSPNRKKKLAMVYKDPMRMKQMV